MGTFKLFSYKKVNSFKTHSQADQGIGMLIMTGAMLTGPLIDAFAKLASASLAPGEIACARFVFQCVFLLPLLIFRKSSINKTFSKRYILMGIFIASSTLFLFWGLQYLPLANNIAIFFVEPLILTLISGLFLKERIRSSCWIAVFVGFIGALIVIRPNWSAYGIAAVLPFLSGTCFAIYLAITRTISASEDVISLQFRTGFIAALTLSFALLIGTLADMPVFLFTKPTMQNYILLCGIGMVSATTHVMIAIALKKTAANILAPFQYLEIISAALLGWFIFADIPDAMTITGACIIIGSGLYVFVIENKHSAA